LLGQKDSKLVIWLGKKVSKFRRSWLDQTRKQIRRLGNLLLPVVYCCRRTDCRQEQNYSDIADTTHTFLSYDHFRNKEDNVNTNK